MKKKVNKSQNKCENSHFSLLKNNKNYFFLRSFDEFEFEYD